MFFTSFWDGKAAGSAVETMTGWMMRVTSQRSLVERLSMGVRETAQFSLSLSLHCFPFLCIIPSSSRDMGRPSRCNECSTAIDQLSRFPLCTKCRLNKPGEEVEPTGEVCIHNSSLLYYIFSTKKYRLSFGFFLGLDIPSVAPLTRPLLLYHRKHTLMDIHCS